MHLLASPGRKRIFSVFGAQGPYPVAANVVLFPLNKICKLKQMWLFLYMLYVTV